MTYTKAWLCEKHWERCLDHNPCSTCPSRPENKEAAEALAALQPEEHAMLNSAVMRKLQALDKDIHGDENGTKGCNPRLFLLEEQAKWRETSSERWLSRLGMIVTCMIAMAALQLSTWDIMTRP